MGIRKENAIKTKEKLIFVADELIKKYGFNKLSIEDITRQAGVATGTFYVYFKHKEDIVFEICKNLFKKTQLKLDKIKNADVSEKLCLYFECFIREVQGYQIHIAREWIKGIVEKNADRKSMGLIKWQYDIEMIKNILYDAVNGQELKSDTPVEILAEMILCELYGMITCWCMSDGVFNPEEKIKDFCEIKLKTMLNQYKKNL